MNKARWWNLRTLLPNYSNALYANAVKHKTTSAWNNSKQMPRITRVSKQPDRIIPTVNPVLVANQSRSVSRRCCKQNTELTKNIHSVDFRWAWALA